MSETVRARNVEWHLNSIVTNQSKEHRMDGLSQLMHALVNPAEYAFTWHDGELSITPRTEPQSDSAPPLSMDAGSAATAVQPSLM